MFTTILTVVFLVLAAISTLPGIIKARKRCWVEALVRIFTALVSAAIAVPLTSLISFKLGDALIVPLLSLMPDSDIAGILHDVPSAEKLADVMLALILTAFVFIALFLVIKLILNLAFAKLLTKLCLTLFGKKERIAEIYPKKGEVTEKKRKFSPLSAAIGALCGLFVFFVSSIPVAGTLDTLSVAGKTISDGNDMVYEVSAAASDNLGTTTVMTAARPVYDTLTSYTVDSEEVVVINEVKLMAMTASAIIEMSSEEEGANIRAASDLREAGELAKDTTLAPALLSEFINAAAPCWLRGEDFHGLSMPSFGENSAVNTMIASLLEDMSHSTPESMKEDISTITNVIAIVIENSADTADLLANEEAITKISVELLNNERLSATVGGVMDSTVESVGAQITLPEQDSEDYQELTSTLASSYNDIIVTDHSGEVTEDSLNDLSSTIGTTLADNGITVTPSEQKIIATTLISKLGTTDVSDAQIAALLEQYR